MKILIIGDEYNLQETQMKFGNGHAYSLVGAHYEAGDFIDDSDLIFDFIIDEEPDQFEIYTDKDVIVFLNTCKVTLGELAHMVDNIMSCTIFGFNGLPSLFNRPVLEATVWQKADEMKLKKTCEELKTEFFLVDDRVGLVTPRVITMIINEAYYTVQEGTATREDIDIAMKLGTNYPYGPFEWSERIGIKNIYELLEALYEDTKDERYKICPLLKKEYLQNSEKL